MAEAGVRVALLARPGEARDQLRRALAELGAELVAEGDPAELDPAMVAGNEPRVVLVSLEPAVEDALERFDDLLARPDVQVMYDDAEVTGQLDGWDLARWARHLAAKLVGGDVLPPVPGDAEALPQMDFSTMEPGAPPTPADVMADEKLEDYAAESLDLSEWVPSEPRLVERGEQAEAPPAPEAADGEGMDLDLDLAGLELALAGDEETPGEPEAGAPAPAPAASSEDDLDFDASLLDVDLSSLPDEEAPLPTLEDDAPAETGDEPLLADLSISDEPVNFSSFSDADEPPAEGLDDDVAALAAQLEAFEAQDQREQPPEPDFDLRFEEPAAEPARETGPPAGSAPPPFSGSSFGNLELAPMDDTPADTPVEVAFAPPSNAAQQWGKGLSLAEQDAAPRQSIHAGALLVLAGLGGPDAVRQLLAALPVNLPLPVLLYQHLDTGKHDRLVGQLGKASQMPLDLAVEGKLAYPGRVAVLPPGMATRRDGNNLVFAAGDLADVLSSLPAENSGVLVLSGADPALVDSLLKVQDAGGLVLAQEPSGCFDPTSAQAVADAGAFAGTPGDLAARIIERWQ